MTPPLPARQRHPPNRYSPSHYSLSIALDPTSYRDVECHPECALALGILSLLLPVFVPSHVSGSTRLRLAPMDLLSAIKRILWFVASSRSRVVIMMRLLHLWLI
jgi:hypothetical protein